MHNDLFMKVLIFFSTLKPTIQTHYNKQHVLCAYFAYIVHTTYLYLVMILTPSFHLHKNLYIYLGVILFITNSHNIATFQNTFILCKERDVPADSCQQLSIGVQFLLL